MAPLHWGCQRHAAAANRVELAWSKLKGTLLNTATEVCSFSKNHQWKSETWWNEQVGKAIQEKLARFKSYNDLKKVGMVAEAMGAKIYLHWRQARDKACCLAGKVWGRERGIPHNITRWWLCFLYRQTDGPQKPGRFGENYVRNDAAEFALSYEDKMKAGVEHSGRWNAANHLALQVRCWKLLVRKVKGSMTTQRRLNSWSLVLVPLCCPCIGVGNNSIQCSQWMPWANKRCSGVIKRLVADPNHVCRRCNDETLPISGRIVTEVDVDGTMLHVEAISCYLGICCAPVGAVTIPLVPDFVWPGESSENSCLYYHQSPRIHGNV